jgi:hypothetical protein
LSQVSIADGVAADAEWPPLPDTQVDELAKKRRALCCAPNGGNSLRLARAGCCVTFGLNKKCHFIKGIIFALLYFHILFANTRHAANTNLRAAFRIILAALTALSGI